MSEGWMRGGHAAVGVLSALLLFSSPVHAEGERPNPGEVGPIPSPSGGRDEVIRQGTAVPGSRVAIGPDGPIPPGTSFRWEQVEGPTVPLDDPTAAKIRFVVPEGTRELAFRLTVRDDRGERSTRVAVPIAARPAEAPPGPLPSSAAGLGAPLMADGGDDQIGLVGRRITLNGTASRPAGQVGYRWIQLAGPAPSQVREDGGYYSFVPTAAGVHRFALVVAHQSLISKPDLVSVEVGQAPAADVPSDGPSPLARSVAAGVGSIPQGAETAAQVADVLESVAERASVYNTIGELQSELTRRLDVVIPNAPAIRAAWSGQVFVPLSQHLAAEFSAAGVDFRSTSDSPRPLDRAQRDRIQAIFRDLAGAFRPQRGRF